jgi:hypothetical protein
MAAADTAAAGTWAAEDKRRMLHVVYRVGDMQVRDGYGLGGLGPVGVVVVVG